MPVSAQESAQKLTLEQAFQIALKQHPSLKRVEAQVGAADARVREAQAGWMPTLVLQGTATDGPSGAPAFGPIGIPANYGAPPLSVEGLAGDPLKKQFGGGLTVTQTLFDFGRTEHLVAARTELLRAAEEDAETQKALVLLLVQQAYLNVLRAQQLAEVQQENVRRRETTVSQAQLLVAGQLKPGVDLQLAQADAADANVGLIAAQNEVSYAYADLNNAMGATSLTTYQLEPVASVMLAQTTPPGTFEDAIQRARARRPELKSAVLQREAADQSVRGVRSELLPRFDAIASVGVVNPSSLIKNSKNYAVGLAVSIPLYTGGIVEGRIAEEQKKRDAILAQEQEVFEAIKLQVSRAWLDVQTNEAQVKAAQAQATYADSSLQLASERYRLQLNTLVELTEAEALAVRARAQLVNAQYGLDVARATLDWAIGETYQKYARPAGTRMGGKA
ncbi:MAG TPA: TolC family protein [Chthonomonadaceae bacterium]|nr:TolC family protein [Chthonomonadaceae bacterium]